MAASELLQEKPLNREPPVQELISRFITEHHGYDRNHGPIPQIDAATHRVRVQGLVRKPLELSAAQLRHDFPQHEVVCALQCAGNRRHTMRTKLKEVSGIDWGDGAVMNCKWKGPRLRDVLNEAVLHVAEPAKAHVSFACHATLCEDDTWYGGSIPLQRGMREGAEVVLALEMNGEALPVRHGYPVRVIAPGIAGARCVKWLDEITVQMEESPNFYQQRDYKVLPPEATDMEVAEKYWSRVPAVQDMPVNSVVAVPGNGEQIRLRPDGTVEIRGYALPQGDQGPVCKVEISTDDGGTWSEAAIVEGKEGHGKWCWALWRAAIALEKGSPRRVLSRATDAGGNTQTSDPQWNLRGVNYNGYGEASGLIVV